MLYLLPLVRNTLWIKHFAFSSIKELTLSGNLKWKAKDITELSRETNAKESAWKFHVKWEVKIKVWDRSQRKKSGSGSDPRVHNMLLRDWSFRILGLIPEQHFMDSGLKTSLFWVRLGKSMSHRPINSLQGLEIELELSIWSQR